MVISFPYIFQILYVLCFTRPRYQVSVYRTIGPLVISLYLKAFNKSLVQINTVVSEKIRFEFLYVHDLGPRSRNDLDLQYSYIFIKSICLRSLSAIVSEKSTVFTFSHRKA